MCSRKSIEKWSISLYFFLMQVFSEKSDAANLGAVYSVLLTFKLILSNMSFFSAHKTKLLGCFIGDKMLSTVKLRIKLWTNTVGYPSRDELTSFKGRNF